MENWWDLNEEDKVDIEDTAMSFDSWKDIGLYVRKGEKSTLRDAAGVPQFTLAQVRPYGSAGQLTLTRCVATLDTDSRKLYDQHVDKIK